MRNGDDHKASSATPAGNEVTAAVLVIGDEILSGRTKDKNSGFIADQCTAVGIRLREIRVVADDTHAIVAALNALRHAYSYVFTTGGIGPTHDDITADAIALAFEAHIDVDPRAVTLLRERFSEAELTPVRLRMARIPTGARLIENKVSKAPGFMLGNVIVMAGVPAIMQSMMETILPDLKTGLKLISRTVKVDAPEGEIATLLGDCQKRYPSVPMGSYPFYEGGLFGTNLVLRSAHADLLTEAKAALTGSLQSAGVVFHDLGT